MSGGKRKVHIELSIPNIAFAHALSDGMKCSVGKAVDHILTAARESGQRILAREQVLPGVIADLEARVAKGTKEYGEPLTTNNGRDSLIDAYEEVLDLGMYLKQHLMERGL